MNCPRGSSRLLYRLACGAALCASTVAGAVETASVAIPATRPTTRPSLAAVPATRPATRPTGAASDETTPGLLGEVFESKSAGISFTAPVDCTKLASPASNQIVGYTNEKKHWSLIVTRSTLGQPLKLETVMAPDGKTRIPGLLDLTIDQLKTAIPGATVLRRDVINIGPNYCGMVALRYTLGRQRWLQQQATLQVNEQLYYVLKFLTPAGEAVVAEGAEDNAPADPIEKTAVETFSGVLDSVKVLDRSDIYADQVSRLYRTRSMFLNWTPKKFREIIIDPSFHGRDPNKAEEGREQFFLVYQGSDVIGYRYQEDLIQNRDGKDGFVVYIRSHTEREKDKPFDIGSNMWTSFDRRAEKWVHTGVLRTANPKAANGWDQTYSTEVGSMEWDTKMAYAPLSGAVNDDEAKREAATGIKRNVPKMRQVELHMLDVSTFGKSETAKPQHVELPPFYLPQAAGHLLAQLLLDPRPFEKRTYMFATYVGETHELTMRYVEVEMPRRMTWKQQQLDVVPVSDHLGLDGPVTTHYITLDGKYLYSENKETRITFMPTTEEDVRRRWKEADFSKQEDVPGKPAASIDDGTPSRGLPAAIR